MDDTTLPCHGLQNHIVLSSPTASNAFLLRFYISCGTIFHSCHTQYLKTNFGSPPGHKLPPPLFTFQGIVRFVSMKVKLFFAIVHFFPTKHMKNGEGKGAWCNGTLYLAIIGNPGILGLDGRLKADWQSEHIRTLQSFKRNVFFPPNQRTLLPIIPHLVCFWCF